MKSKIVDCFLYFQEKELLKLRLEYLNDFVDYFVIVEASQSFSGKKKDFNFEKEKKQFEPYLHKIIYYKIEDTIKSFDDLVSQLEKKNDFVSKNILSFMNSHSHYNKDLLNWVLDTFHRESIAYPLNQMSLKADDVVLLSDIDEIPSHNFLKSYLENPIDHACNKQFQFSFFLNLLSDDHWIGTIISKWNAFKDASLTDLRIDSKKNQTKVKNLNLDHGGFHFTSYGDIKQIENKIRNWSHQEFNNFIVLKFLKLNLQYGMDIFGRSLKSQYQVIDIGNEKFFSKQLSSIIQDNQMFLSKPLKKNYPLYYIFFFILGKLFKIFYYLTISFKKKV